MELLLLGYREGESNKGSGKVKNNLLYSTTTVVKPLRKTHAPQ